METDTVLGYLGALALNASHKGNERLFHQLCALGKARDPASIVRAINIVNLAKQRPQDDVLLPKVCLRQIFRETFSLLIKEGGISPSCYCVIGWGNFELDGRAYADQKAAKRDSQFLAKKFEMTMSSFGHEIIASIKFSRKVIDERIPCLFVEQRGETYFHKEIERIPRDLPTGCDPNDDLIFRHPLVAANFDSFYRALGMIRGNFILVAFYPDQPPCADNFPDKRKALKNLYKIGAPMAFVYDRLAGKVVAEVYSKRILQHFFTRLGQSFFETRDYQNIKDVPDY